jgi:FHS family L-fucose permease-like MFS transporter
MHPTAGRHVQRTLLPTISIAILFAIAGVGFWNDILLFPKFAQFFSIDLSHVLWIQALYSLGYILAALPSALFHRKFGYKIGMIFALGLVSIGPFLIYPAIAQHGVTFFLLAVVLVGIGWSTLETSLNPLVVEMGRPETAVRRINFLQAFFPVGLVIGFICGRWFYPSDMHLSLNVLAEAAARPYVIVGLIVLFIAFLVERVEFPARSGIRSGGIADVGNELRILLASPAIKFGMAGTFACIALQSTLQGATYQYVMQEYAGYTDPIAQIIVFTGLVVFGVGRFIGAALMGRIESNRLFQWALGFCVVLTLGALAIGGTTGLVCLVATNLCMGIGYPTVLGTTLKDLQSEANVAAGLLVTASGFAGLVIPLAMNFVIAAANVRIAILMALPCFLILYFYTRHILQAHSKEQSASSAA